MRSFPLAPMSALFLWLTVGLMPLPFVFLLAPGGPTEPILRGTGLFVALIYASVWFWWRPSRFEIDADALTAVFPMRRRRTPRAEILRAEVLDMAAFRARWPRAMRVGAGGLWGGFGWLRSSRGWVEFYISRMDRLVLIERRDRIPLLISPADPEAFVQALIG